MPKGTKEPLDLGITRDELRDRIIDGAISRISEGIWNGADVETLVTNAVEKIVRDEVEKAANETVATTFEEFVRGAIENVVLQETNKWGEKRGEPVSLREYLVGRAEAWMTETVNYEGKTKSEDRFGSWHGATTRLGYAIDSYLQYHISSAMKTALADLNSKVSVALTETVKLQLSEVLGKIRTEVKTR